MAQETNALFINDAPGKPAKRAISAQKNDYQLTITTLFLKIHTCLTGLSMPFDMPGALAIICAADAQRTHPASIRPTESKHYRLVSR
jgi:hypothetical protein